MLKKRLIAVILLRDGKVVQSVKFKHTNVIHYNAIHAIESFNRWAIDEIVILNVSKSDSSKNQFLETIDAISKTCFVPITVGGWIDSVEYASKLLASGGDKISINTHCFKNPKFISELSKKFGSQSVVVSIDSKKNDIGEEKVVIERGTKITHASPIQWAIECERLGAGEILINSIDHDGNRKGYNLPLIKSVVSKLSIPVIAMGGVLTWDHLIEGVIKTNPSGVAAANIFHYTEHSTKKS
ncbi:imidazole glycerol phosphate synthase cyclase subunit [Flavobacteriaceae bacterium]|nr:imidazole glycerol phosphate synthase cyclase subunit [Flavobacteriaceae bacterium]